MIYSIPLDNARQDAAPHGHHGGSSGGGIGGGGPGGGAAGGSGGGPAGGSGSPSTSASPTQSVSTSAKQGGAVLVPGGQPGSLVHSGNGFGSSSAVPGLNAPASSGFRAVQSNASDAPLFAILLALGVICLGAFVGARSWRVARGHAGGLALGSSEPPQLPPAHS